MKQDRSFQRRKLGLTCCVVMAVLLTHGLARAGDGTQRLELGSPFVDDAILQRDMPVPVWGWARPGSSVSVTFGAQTKTARANAQGRWRVTLDPLAASLEERSETYGQDKVTFLCAQPTATLVDGIRKPQIKNGVSVEFDAWPVSLKDIAARLGESVKLMCAREDDLKWVNAANGSLPTFKALPDAIILTRHGRLALNGMSLLRFHMNGNGFEREGSGTVTAVALSSFGPRDGLFSVDLVLIRGYSLRLGC